MRRLMLLRHAKSDWSQAGQSDHERPLNERGRRTAPLIGAYLARHDLIPDLVLCSTAARTRATWDLVAAELPGGPKVAVRFDETLYAASAKTIIERMHAAAGARTLLLIGHNPGLAEAAIALTASGDIDARERLHEKFPTAGLAVIDFPVDDWSAIQRHSGRLDRFIAPRMLEEATE